MTTTSAGPAIRAEGLVKRFGRSRRSTGSRSTSRPAGSTACSGPNGSGQDHADPAADRDDPGDRGPRRGPGRHDAVAADPRADRVHDPGRRRVPGAHRRRERAVLRRRLRRRDRRRRRRGARAGGAARTAGTRSPARCPAGSAGGSRWPARWSTGRRCCSSTSPRWAWTRCSGSSSGATSATWPTPARRSSSRAT